MCYNSAPAYHATKLVAGGTQLVDVRERHEFASGSLPQARSIPLSELAGRYLELNPDRPVAVLCRSGGRSARAAEFLCQHGFRNVTNLDGGMLST
jgi:rhodanese-related sulfurtransferase